MQYGITNQNCVPVRKENSDPSEMVTQLLFGDTFRILETKKNWTRIQITYDFYEGWISTNQFQSISEETYHSYNDKKDAFLTDLVDLTTDPMEMLLPLSIGANLKALSLFNLSYDGEALTEKLPKSQLIGLASSYLNAPYLWGGKTPFGIDCSGLTQMVYKIAGYQLFRDASQQAKQGEALSFIEESEPGDLAFFDNEEGNIIHVGLIMKDNYIMHAHGKVRIDRLDHTGIFNVDTKLYSHNLRVIKKII